MTCDDEHQAVTVLHSLALQKATYHCFIGALVYSSDSHCVCHDISADSSCHLQIVLEVHDTAGRLHQIIAMLEAEGYAAACKHGLGPETHMVYARRS